MTGSRVRPRLVKVFLELKTGLPLLNIQDRKAWQEALQTCSTLFHIENEVISVKATGGWPERRERGKKDS